MSGKTDPLAEFLPAGDPLVVIRKPAASPSAAPAKASPSVPVLAPEPPPSPKPVLAPEKPKSGQPAAIRESIEVLEPVERPELIESPEVPEPVEIPEPEWVPEPELITAIPIPGSPPIEAEPPVFVAPSDGFAASPRRRRGLPWVRIGLIGFSIGLAAVVGVLGIAHLSDDKAPTRVAETQAPRKITPTPAISPSIRTSRRGGSLAGDLDPSLFDRPADEAVVPEPSFTPTPPTMPEPSDAAASPVNPVPSPAINPPVPSAQAIEQGRRTIEQVATALDTGQLGSLQTLADSAVALAANPDQERQSEALRQFAELVFYYQGAVDRTLGLLQVGDSIDLTPALKISIVEISDERIVIRSAGKNKRYPREDMPLVLVDRLAEDSLQTAGATGLAAKACFHAVSPIAGTQANRRQALGWLQSIESDIVGADRNALIDVMEIWLNE